MKYIKLAVYIVFAILFTGCVSSGEPSGSCEVRIDAGDYIVLEWIESNIFENDTVFEITKRITRDEKLHMEFSGSGVMAYINGIDNLYEFDKGPMSGWVYRVNGSEPTESCGNYAIKDGDKIEWIYSTEINEE